MGVTLTQKFASRRKKKLSPYHAPSGVKLFGAHDGFGGHVHSIAFDPLCRAYATGSEDRRVRLWEWGTWKLLMELSGHRGRVWGVAFDPKGRRLASISADSTLKLWDAANGKLLHTLEGHVDAALSLAFHPQGRLLASGGGHSDSAVKIWGTATGEVLKSLKGHRAEVYGLAFDPRSGWLASGGSDKNIRIWDPESGKLLRVIESDQGPINSMSFAPQGGILATAHSNHMVKIWDSLGGKLLRTLEGHTDSVGCLAFSPDGRIMASKSEDDSVRLWDCRNWEPLAIIPDPTFSHMWHPSLVFHPTLPILATAGSGFGETRGEDSQVRFWEINFEDLLSGKLLATYPQAVHHTTAKVLLVGNHSVGKSALGHRLIHGDFETQESTHGQRFWVFPALGKRRADGTDCEAILWDFAGQPDYRLVHALFLDDADLALVLFDASDLRDPMQGVGFWLKQLRSSQSRCPIILVAAQADRGSCTLSPDELKAYCRNQGINGPFTTSALTGDGFEALVECMQTLIPWDDKPAIVTTLTFKRIKEHLLSLKENRTESLLIVSPSDFQRRLESVDADWRFTEDEVLTGIGHLENYGYVKRLRTSKGDLKILLQPERLNNLASSLVLEARRNPKGLGALEERRLLSGGYDFPELKDLAPVEREVLLDSAVLLFLEHNICFRESDPLRMEPYLVFPELINLKTLREEGTNSEDAVAYTVKGQTENVFASLVVLLGYTHTFTRTAQWSCNARYEVGNGLVCGFRQEAERDGELDFVLCFGPDVGQPVRTLFQGLFESLLSRRNLTVLRYEPVYCTNANCSRPVDRSVVRQRIKEGKSFTFCNECGERLSLPKVAEPIQLTLDVQAEVQSQRRTAELRTRFEKAVFQVRTFALEQKLEPPECFISYAWGDTEQERWVEKRLATDLQKAGIEVVLDRWHNAQVGASVARFVERIEACDKIVVVGTPQYRRKYANKDSQAGYVVAAEVDLIANRLLGTESKKESVLPVLLKGEKAEAFPPLLHGRVYADFRDDVGYFTTTFDLLLSIYGLLPNHSSVADLRDSLRVP